MRIYQISPDEVQGLIDCYIQVFKTLEGILPTEYVETQVEKASTQEFFDDMMGKVDTPDNILLVSSLDEKIIGIAWGNIKEDGSAWLGFMGVKKPHRSSGIGRALLHQFIDECLVRGSSRVSLNTDPRLVPALKLYESEGFVRGKTVTNPFGLELIIFSKEIA